MGIPARRRREIEQKVAAREARYHDRVGDLLGLADLDALRTPQAPAFYSPSTGVVCVACKQFAQTPIRIIWDADTPCEHCGKRLDHVQRHEPR